ncbi:MAG: hypothetical protein JXQ90_17920 [Cyclobacteriaceae bacterium]
MVKKPKSIYMHYEGDVDIKKVEIDDHTRVGDVIKEHLPQFANSSDYNEDLEAYVEDGKEQLSKDSLIADLKLENKGHLHFSRCSRVKTSVLFGDQQFVFDDLKPAFTLRKVRRILSKEGNISQQDLKGHKFRLTQTSNDLDLDSHLGSFTTYPSCEVKLYLVKPVKIQGFVKPEVSLFLDHIESNEFQSGVDRGYWEVIDSDQISSTWPLVFVRVAQGNKKFTLRFDLSGYPVLAPKGELWDEEKNTLLSKDKRPTGCENLNVAVRMSYGGPPQTSLYIPCDRGALTTHPEWREKYPVETWKKGDQVAKYLRFFHSLLNT